MNCLHCCKKIDSGEESHYGMHNECFQRAFRVSDLPEFIDVVRIAADSGSADSALGAGTDCISSFFQGKFRKYAAELKNDHYILKVEQKEYPELPAVEFLSNQIAVKCSLEVPEFHLINYHGRSTFAVLNFIPKGRKETLHHIRHFLTGLEFNCESLVEVIIDKTGRLSEVERFVNLCLFDSLIGNHDRHGRNIALIENRRGFRLSPFYDNPSYLGVEEQDLLAAKHSPRGRIAVLETDQPVMADYCREFRRLGYGNVIDEFRGTVAKSGYRNLTGWKFISESRNDALMRLIVCRVEELNNG